MKGLFAAGLSLLVTASLLAQPAPQTARQALIEMLFGKPGSFEKHLPKATIAALREASGNGASMLDQFSMLSALAKTQNSHLQTFEAGSTLLTLEDERTQSKFEVTVENDDLRGDEDEIQLAFHGTKENQSPATPLLPTFTVLMKQETGIWKLNEISVTLRVPLADPEFLKGVVAGIKQRQTMAGNGSPVFQNSGTASAQATRPSEALAISAVRAILTAEATYAATYPSHGFTCTLSDLDGFGSDSPNEQHAMLIESRLASGKKAGYVFVLSGCTGTPSSHFQLAAVPATPAVGARAFCADQSAVIRSSSDGQAATCFAGGTPLQ